ncbi:MAG TPA: 3-hydroxybutyryl-CoA dehydrogenase [Bacillota bacterium]|nr:3-hydroxybutyryl-CoA dehydrogenase [Bacillota bacterium]HOB42406.1 3-hydroxybutyryl-CoA dehydrogenase [Bacillota bacterium]HOL51039.1 3-hydroxybutyryl-CoA dehydrogenase [Bacillota bacterium]HOO30357.1 3-hydroxybutyryl-CoA dehydrogenase [Bacillota bacterium]HPQ02936.1 3-hydroxybutyryl-CoA dehydrogenase [Bacillota bacterium]
MSIDRILVVGAGQMGSGIAQVAAEAGLEVSLADLSVDYARKGVDRILKSLNRQVEKGRLTEEDKEDTVSRINCVPDYSAGGDVDLVIEAIVEDPKVKSKLFAELASICPPEAIFASNTSSVSITSLARDSGRPDRFIGMHFMNPVPVMQLVEVVRGLATSDETCEIIVDLARRMGKEPVVVADSPAFIVNRMAIPMINEAIFALSEGISDAEGIDACAKLGLNHPMGPLALGDLIGLDTVLSILEVMFQETGDPKYRPCPLLRRMVAAGRLGRKSGRGFYEYS